MHKVNPVAPLSAARSEAIDAPRPASVRFEGRQLTLKEALDTPDGASSAHQANMAAVVMSVSTAKDRLDYLDRMGVRPTQVVRAAADYRYDPVPGDHPKAANTRHQFERMRVDVVALPDRPVGIDAGPTRRILDAVPLALPDRREAHTLDTGKYLANRIASGVAEYATRHGCAFFCGGGEAEMLDHYRSRGFDQAVRISSNTSTRAHLLSSSTQGTSVLVLSGMNSETRVKHQMLQLHFAGVDLGEVTLVGDLGAQKQRSEASLGQALAELPSADHKTLFIGCRWQIMECLGRQFHVVDAAEPEGTGYAQLQPVEHAVAGFVFDTATVDRDGGRHLVAALRMPNGDLAHTATKAFLAHGFDHVVMCGAGGRLAGVAQVGDYMVVDSSRYGAQRFSLPPSSVLAPPGPMFSHASSANITVDSPLQENQRWLEENRATGNVDVETAHIFRALHESGDDVRVIPGLFVSDVVGEHPLEGKISTGDAYRQLPGFVEAAWQSMWDQAGARS